MPAPWKAREVQRNSGGVGPQGPTCPRLGFGQGSTRTKPGITSVGYNWSCWSPAINKLIMVEFLRFSAGARLLPCVKVQGRTR